MRKLRIAVLNNYDLSIVEREVINGEVPNHLLFGLNFLRDFGHKIETFSVNCVSEKQKSIKDRFFQYFTHFENLDLQMEIFKKRNEFDIIFCLCGGVSEWLYLQNARKNLNKPILTLYHHPLATGKLDFIRNLFRKRIYKNQSMILCLADKTAESFNKLLKGQVAHTISWGVDHNFYSRINGHNPKRKKKEIVLTCGRTSRDLSTFVKAVEKSNEKGHIICPDHHDIPSIRCNNLFTFERTSYSSEKKDNTYHKMANLMHKVRVIAIPLEKQRTLAGLTSLMDCLGFGKPVIMTRNPCIDFDIEKLGIGTWVEPYDVDGWAKAIKWHFLNEKESLIMGSKAKALSMKLSAESFGRKINKIINEHHKNWKIS